MINPLIFLTDPVFRAPTIGCMLMCLAAGLVGVMVFLRKESLIGEALSHAAYPGIIFGVVASGLFSITDPEDSLFTVFTLSGALLTAFLGMKMIHFLEEKVKVASDASLCFVLSAFFGVGVTFASEVQFSFTSLYKSALGYLYGQAATMTDVHIYIYALLAFFVIFTVFIFFKEFQTLAFDREYAFSMGLPVSKIDYMLFLLILLSVIIGARSVGVVLMSAMLIAPPVAARQWTDKLSLFFVLSGLFGVASGFLGNYFSANLTESVLAQDPASRFSLPTGPMIVLVAASFCLISLFFSPRRGLLTRFIRMKRFRHTCLCENILKSMWRINQNGPVSLKEIQDYQTISHFYLKFILRHIQTRGWIVKKREKYSLTEDGRQRAAKIVRLHRLWEVYLSYLGVGMEKIHKNAEEIEHILTPELEKSLIELLRDPKSDPHHQPIPPKEEFYAG